MTFDEMKDRLNAEWIGGRLVAEVDGAKEYLTITSESGEVSFTEVGLRMQFELEQAPAPKPRRKKAEEAPADGAAASDDVEIEV